MRLTALNEATTAARLLLATSVVLGLVAVASGLWALSDTNRTIGPFGEFAGGAAVLASVTLVALRRSDRPPDILKRHERRDWD